MVRIRLLLGVCVVLGAGGAAWARPCVVEGKSVDPFPLTVSPKGGLALSLKVRDVPASAKIGEAQGPATVDVRGALAFSGIAPVDKLPLKWKSTVDSANGMLRLSGGATVVLDMHARGRWLEGDLLFDGIRFHGVTLPCDGLTLDPVAPTTANSEPEEDVFIAKAKSLTLRAAAGSGPTMEIVLPEPGSISWHRVEHAGALVRIAAKLRDGTYVTGWLKPGELTRPAAAPSSQLGELPVTTRCVRPLESAPGTQVVKASVAANTQVLYDRLFPWATVKGGESIQVRLPSGGNWAELVGVPGVATATDCDADTLLDQAWVARTAVHIQGGKAPVDAGAKN